MTLKLADSSTFDPTKRGFWAKSNEKTKSADVWLYEEIGSGWMGGISAKDFADTINGLGKVDTINVYMNSPGGSVFDGQAMYATLNRHPARITMHVDGLAASIASLILMAGNEINVSAGAQIMVHAPWSITAGNAQDFRDTADVLDKIDSQLVDIYAARTKQTREQISAWMGAETWMTADDAVANGFADKKTEALRVAACAFDLKAFGYRHAPQQCGIAPNVEPAAAPATAKELRERTIDMRNKLYGRTAGNI